MSSSELSKYEGWRMKNGVFRSHKLAPTVLGMSTTYVQRSYS